MKIVALISGGKDSCYNMMQCVSEGHEIVALANLKPKDKDELDSYMYQSVGHHAIDLYAEAMGLPLYRRTIEGLSQETGRDYTPNPEDEVEDLYQLLKTVQAETNIEGVSVGAILSNYQRVRVENVCSRLGLTSLAYLWRRDQEELLDEMIRSKVKAIIIKVAAMGLNPDKHLGKTLEEMQSHLLKMRDDFDLNVCGEGGEFETFTLDCPLFNKVIVIDESESVLHSADAFAPVGYQNLRKAHLEDKNMDPTISQLERLRALPMKRGSTLYSELFLDSEQVAECQHEEMLLAGDRDLVQDDLPWCIQCKDDHLWISGVIAKYKPDEDIHALTKAALTQLQDVVCQCGTDWDMSCIVLVHLYVNNMADFADVNSVYKTFFKVNPASRVCVQSSLPENIGLQIDCYGYRCHGDRETMHVQGLSHWAPANIGPYSQAVMINKKIYIAGQIAMCPSNLKIIQGGILAECRLSLRHVDSVSSAISPGTGIRRVVSCVCYLTSSSYIATAKQEWNRKRSCENSSIEILPCTVQYVIVPALPKAALIEWQVMTSQYTQQQCKELTNSLQTNMVEIVVRCVCEEEAGFLASTANVYLRKDCQMSDLNLDETLKTFVTCYKKILQKETIPDTVMMRVFYKASIMKYEKLYKAVSSVLEGAPFSLVPVQKLETQNMILSVCSH